MRIKDIHVELRPRERLKMHGAAALSDAELWAVVLRTGTRKDNAIDLSNRLISEYGIDRLSSCSLKERISFGKNRDKHICSAKDVFDYIAPVLLGAEKECFVVMHLDSKNRVIKHETVSVGILDSSLAHPREVFRSAIKDNCYAVILVHNHPSGDSTPSDEDNAISEVMFATGKVLGISMLDHVVIGSNECYSFVEKRKFVY